MRKLILGLATALLVMVGASPAAAGEENPAWAVAGGQVIGSAQNCGGAFLSMSWVGRRGQLSVSDTCTDGYRAVAYVDVMRSGSWVRLGSVQDTYNNDDTAYRDFGIANGTKIQVWTCVLNADTGWQACSDKGPIVFTTY